MGRLWILWLLSLSAESQTLQEVTLYSFEHNYQLQILEQKLAILAQQATLVATLSDPILKLGINDLPLDNPLSRNVEAMQNQFITLSQRLPLSDKLERSSEVEYAKQALVEQEKVILKVRIASEIRQSFIEVAFAKKRLRILDQYIAFLKQPLKLIVHLSAVEQNMLESYIQTQLLQEHYRLEREVSLERIAIAKEQVERIGNLQVEQFEGGVVAKNYLEDDQATLLARLVLQNPELKKSALQNVVEGKNIALSTAREQADITITGGYYQRFDREDYLSVSVSYPLYVRNRQSKEKIQAMRRADIASLSYQERKASLLQGLKIRLHQLHTLDRELTLLIQSQEKIRKLIDTTKAKLGSGEGSLRHYYGLFTQKTDNALAINQKRLALALVENQISQLLGGV